MDETRILERFILGRTSPDIRYFVLDFVCSGFEAEALAEMAKPARQANAMGYLSEIIEIALRDGYWRKNVCLPGIPEPMTLKVDFPGFERTREEFGRLHKILYAEGHNSEWEFLHTDMDKRIQRILEKRKKLPLEQKWHVHSTLTPEEMADWLHIYFRWSNEKEVIGAHMYTNRTHQLVCYRNTS
jgi:hypothetical protein